MPSLFVIGGARSGKSRYAQARAEETGLERIFIATAQAFDNEMRERIVRHQADRDALWQTVEAPLDLADAVERHSGTRRVLLIDCLTLWITNLMLAERDIPAALFALTQAISRAAGMVVLVSNEVGWSIVPENALARRFRDEAGLAHQRVAACVDEVQMVCAGLNLRMK